MFNDPFFNDVFYDSFFDSPMILSPTYRYPARSLSRKPTKYNRLRSLLSDTMQPFDLLDQNFLPSERITKIFAPIDIKESSDSFQYSLDLPGVAKEDIDISVEDRVMTIKAERKGSFGDGKSDKEKNLNLEKLESTSKEVQAASNSESQVQVKKHHSEVYYGAITRSFTLPDNADENEISAKHENGVLLLTVKKRPAKKEEEKVKRIAVA